MKSVRCPMAGEQRLHLSLKEGFCAHARSRTRIDGPGRVRLALAKISLIKCQRSFVGSIVRCEFPLKPGFCDVPVSLDRCRRHATSQWLLLLCLSHQKISVRQAAPAVDRLWASFDRASSSARTSIDCACSAAAASPKVTRMRDLRASARHVPSALHQDLPHGNCGDGQKMRPIMPRLALILEEPEVRFMDERGCLKDCPSFSLFIYCRARRRSSS